MDDEPLFIEELDGPTLTREDLDSQEATERDWDLEQHIARRYGDAGQPIDG